MKAKVVYPKGQKRYRGTIFERPPDSKRYCIRYSAGYDDVNKKYRQVWESGFKTIELAAKRLLALENQDNANTLNYSSGITLSQHLDKWLNDNGSNLSLKTLQGYKSIIDRHINPALGAIPLNKLTPEDIQRYYTTKVKHGRIDGKGALSSTSVSHHHTLLHRALQSAVRAHLIPYNPADVEDKPRPQHTEMRTMTKEEVNIFLRAARTTEYYPLFLTAVMTGARRGELLALCWGDINLVESEMLIDRAVIQLNDRSLHYKTTKTGKGRMVALTPENGLVLRSHKEKREAFCKKMKFPFDDDSLVFCHPDGSPYLPDTITQAWSRLVKKSGLKHIKLHGARHTHATLLLDQNVHPLVVSQRLGHAKISTTLDLYSHVKPELQKAAALKFDTILEKVESNL